MTHHSARRVSLAAIIDVHPDQRWTTFVRSVDGKDIERVLLDLSAETEHLIQDEIGRGMAAAEAMVDVADVSAYALPRVRARRVLAMAQANASQFAEALATCESAIALADQLGLQIDGARCRLASMQPLANLGRFGEAIAAGTHALGILEREEAWELAGRAHLNIGSTWAMCDQPEKALAHFDRARDALEQLPPMLAQIESNRGNALSDLDRYEEAEAAFTASERLFTELDFDWAAAIAASNLAHLSTRQGRLDAALVHFERAYQLLIRDNAIADVARIEAERANALSTLGLRSDAIAAYDRAIPQLQAHGTAIDVALAQIGLGRTLLMEGNSAAAEATLAQAENSLDPDVQPIASAQCAALRADIALLGGDVSSARAFADAAVRTLAGRPFQRAILEMLQARIALADGDPATARDTLHGVLDRVHAVGIAPIVADVHQLLGRVHDELGEETLAIDARRAAIDQVERIRGTLQAERLRGAYLGDRLGVYQELYDALLKQGTADAIREAFLVSERARSRALLDMLGSQADHLAASSPAEHELLAEIDRHQRWLNWTYSQIADGHEPDESLLRQLRQHEQAVGELTTQLGVAAAPGSPHLEPISADQARALLPERGALLSYMEANGELHAILVTEADVVAYPSLVKLPALDQLVQQLQFQIQRAIVRRSGQHRFAARQLANTQHELSALHELILAPLGERLGGCDCLVVVPYGVLHAVPFAALRANDQYVIERHRVVTVPSASIMQQLHPVSRLPDSGPVLVVGVSDDDTPELASEAVAVGAMLPGATVVLDQDATVDAILDHIGSASLVHLACHGQFHIDMPSASGLRFADRWLTVMELYQLRLRALLITLSGCETGISRVETGDELVGLANAMLAAGAQSLVVSLWMTEDRVASDLMTRLYRNLGDGSSPLEALREAQLIALGNHAHPAFWAPFVFIGRP